MGIYCIYRAYHKKEHVYRNLHAKTNSTIEKNRLARSKYLVVNCQINLKAWFSYVPGISDSQLQLFSFKQCMLCDLSKTPHAHETTKSSINTLNMYTFTNSIIHFYLKIYLGERFSTSLFRTMSYYIIKTLSFLEQMDRDRKRRNGEIKLVIDNTTNNEN